MSERDAQSDYVPLILHEMRRRNIGLRALALKTSLCKSRVGQLLHRDPAKRSTMSLAEFHKILAALDIDVLQAIISIETLTNDELRASPRYATLVPMVCAMVHDMAANLIRALEDVDEMDGTEVRVEWAAALQRAVIKRVVQEVVAVAGRRAALSDFNLFS